MDPETRPARPLRPVAYVLMSAVVAVATVATIVSSAPLFFVLALLATATMLFAGLVLLIVTIATRRFAGALAVLAALGLVVSPLWVSRIVQHGVDTFSFYRRHASFDRMVAEQGARAPGTPVRMVVEFDDLSMFATDDIFYYVIYDETDRAEVDPGSVTGSWPCSCDPPHSIDVNGSKSIERLSGHYYKMYVTF